MRDTRDTMVDLRRIGRTKRMLRAAIKQVLFGDVIIIVSKLDIAAHMIEYCKSISRPYSINQDKIGYREHSIRFIGWANREWNPNTWLVYGVPEAQVFVDHEAIERFRPELVRALHRWDHPDSAPEIERMPDIAALVEDTGPDLSSVI